MTTLLFVEHGNGQIKDGTLKALSAAKEIGAAIHALVLGTGSKPVAEAAAKLDGVEKVLLSEDGAYDHDLAEPVAALIASIAEPYTTIIASASTTVTDGASATTSRSTAASPRSTSTASTVAPVSARANVS